MSEKTRAERIIEQDPNGLVVLDENLLIKEYNRAFLEIFRIPEDADIINKNVNQVFGQIIFPTADIAQERNRVKYHERSGHYVEPISFSLEMDGLSACFFVDITSHYLERQRMQELKEETITKAHEVINRQMRVAQEIASLLGETTAESKVQILRLIEMLKQKEESKNDPIIKK